VIVVCVEPIALGNVSGVRFMITLLGHMPMCERLSSTKERSGVY